MHRFWFDTAKIRVIKARIRNHTSDCSLQHTPTTSLREVQLGPQLRISAHQPDEPIGHHTQNEEAMEGKAGSVHVDEVGQEPASVLVQVLHQVDGQEDGREGVEGEEEAQPAGSELVKALDLMQRPVEDAAASLRVPTASASGDAEEET